MSAVFPSSKYKALLKDSALFQLRADEGNQRPAPPLMSGVSFPFKPFINAFFSNLP